VSQDLWGYGWRVASFEDEYMHGQCAAWAVAHQREYPHLKFGIDWQRLTTDHPDWDDEDGDDGEMWHPQHIFTHDDSHAYDVRGAHSLDQIKRWDDVTLNHSLDDVLGTGMHELGWEPESDAVRRVPPHTAARLAMPMPKFPDPVCAECGEPVMREGAEYPGWAHVNGDNGHEAESHQPDYWYANPGVDPVHHIPTDEAWEYRVSSPPDHDWGDKGFSTQSLTEDVRQNGIKYPIEIVTDGTHAHVDNGHHRLDAARAAGLSHVPAYVTKLDGDDYPTDHLYDIPPGTRNSGHRRVGPTVQQIISRTHTAGANGDLPEGMKITRKDYPRSGESYWAAHHNGEVIGELNVMPSDYGDQGAVSNIEVHEDYHRRGVGKALWEAAGRPLHTPGQQSVMGMDWAQAVGGDSEPDDWPDDDDYHTASQNAMPDLNKAISDFAQNGYSQEPEWGHGDCLTNSLSFMEGLHPSFNPRLHQFFHPKVSAFPNPAREDLQHSESDPGHWETDELVDDGVYAPADHYAPVINHQGRDHVVDWTMSQFDPHAKVPHIEPLDEYSKRFSYDEPTTEFDTEWKKEARIMTAAVTVYTKPNCPQCVMTKKQLDKLGIDHDTVDVTQDPDAHAYVSGLGYSSAPVVVVNDGESHWSGFRPDHLRGLVE
jgi:glutaredoxin-like protein NrdH